MRFNMKRIKRIDDVAAWRLCMGCGACSYACPNDAVTLVDIDDVGIRPRVDSNKCQNCRDCLNGCPGLGLSHEAFDEESIVELRQGWGQVLEVWEGYAADEEIRFKGSSGGIATALALFCLENKKASGVLHIAANHEKSLVNEAVFSTNREDLLKTTGSRYAPAAVCERFDSIESSQSPVVFIGKPCDVAALRKTQTVNAQLAVKTAVAIGIFCAGTPTTAGTHKVLQAFGVEPDEVEKFCYRGNGWPGMTSAKIKGEGEDVREMTYAQSWGDILSKHVQLRCRLCPDSTGEFADISCGDPWYCDIESDDPGRSLVLVRTKHGRKLVREAMEAGYVKLQKAKPCILGQSQQSVHFKRSQLWARLKVMSFAQIPVPEYIGFSLFRNWLKLSFVEKIKSFLGSAKRMVFRRWFKRQKLDI
jgi:coenzyme F420 hydrogenase subunit beta